MKASKQLKMVRLLEGCLKSKVIRRRKGFIGPLKPLKHNKFGFWILPWSSICKRASVHENAGSVGEAGTVFRSLWSIRLQSLPNEADQMDQENPSSAISSRLLRDFVVPFMTIGKALRGCVGSSV